MVSSMTKTYHEWLDLGSTGVSPNDITFEYDKTRGYNIIDILDENVSQIWERATEQNERLFDGDLFNLVSIDKGTKTITLGPASFRDYYVKVAVLNGETELNTSITSSKKRAFLREQIHVLSSVTALIAEDKLILGKKVSKKPKSPLLLSLPGSGYLDRDEDISQIKKDNVSEVITREIKEETQIIDQIQNIRCFGVYEDTYQGSHRNPALCSLVETSADRELLERRKQTAPDGWEFDDYIFLPIDKTAFRELITAGLYSGNNTDVVEDDAFAISGKTLLSLFLVGRYYFGIDWYKEIIDNHKDEIEIKHI